MIPSIDARIVKGAALVSVLVLCGITFLYARSLKIERAGLKTKHQEVLQLRDEYLRLSSSIGAVEGRRSLARVEGIVQAVDEVFRSLGLNQKVRSVKPLGSREKKFGVEEEAEVQVEKVNMNEMTNILFKIENAPMVLSVRKASIKTSFENPSFLNLTLTLSLIKPK